MHDKLYHVGVKGKVSRSTLADANEKRNWRIYCDFAQKLINQARKLYAEDDFGLELKNTVYVHWIHQRLICAFRFFPGLISVEPKAESSSIL